MCDCSCHLPGIDPTGNCCECRCAFCPKPRVALWGVPGGTFPVCRDHMPIA